MRALNTLLLAAVLATGFSSAAMAQDDEIIVTGTRIASSPGIFIEKRGDFLLLDVRIDNDSREYDERIEQMTETIDDIIAAAKDNPDIILSLIDDNNFVRPLTKQAFVDGIRNGSQPDTSYAVLKVKTNIPEEVADSYKLINKLETFIEGVEATGRTKIRNFDDVAVSILNPYQFRDEVRQKVMDEMESTAETFGSEYVLMPKGLDGPVRWARSGELNLAFFMSTSYKIYPKNLSIKLLASDDIDAFED